MRTLEDELVELLDDGVVYDRSETPIRPIVTLVGTQRASEDVLGRVEQYVVELARKHPNARLVVGDTSSIEKEAVRAATMIGMRYEVVPKGEKGAWDDSALIRDSRCVAKASHVVLFDDSARSQAYRQLAERTMKHVSSL